MIEDSRILLVDDNPEIINLLSDFLEPNRCIIHKAETAENADSILQGNEIDIAIVDVQLPDSNGIALLDLIKVRYPSISVIMTTGYHDLNFVIDAMKKGASDFLMKPFEFDKLMMTLLRVSKERELVQERQSMLSTLEDKKKIEVLNRELQRKIEQLTTMYHISNKFNALSLFDDIYEKIVHIISEILNIATCGYYIIDVESGDLILYRQKTRDGAAPVDKRINLGNEYLTDSRVSTRHFVRNNRLFLPVLIKGECVGYIMVGNGTNGPQPPKKDPLLDRDLYLLRVIAEKASMQIENRILYESLFENIIHTLTSLITAINKRDSYTEGHCMRVSTLSVKLAQRIGASSYERDVLRIVCPLHDLGKIGIPDSILLKPGRLTRDEYQVMTWHAGYGEEIIGRFNILVNEASIIRHHHERFDGAGYPDSLKGNDIPLCSRIISVCDAFDAMTSNRPYRNSMDLKEALQEISSNKGKQFDPEIADQFIEMIHDDIR